MLTLEALHDLAETGEVDTVIVAFTDHYGRLHGKRFDAHFFLGEIAAHGTHACDYLLTVDMEMNPVPGYKYASWEKGYGDFHMVPDLDTLRLASWLDRSSSSSGSERRRSSWWRTDRAAGRCRYPCADTR